MRRDGRGRFGWFERSVWWKGVCGAEEEMGHVLAWVRGQQRHICDGSAFIGLTTKHPPAKNITTM
jgi:hypothetical protein